MAFFSQFPFTLTLAASNPRWLRYEWVWIKSQGTGHLNCNRAPLKAHESVLVFYRKQPSYYPQFAPGKPYVAKRGRGSTNYGKQKDHVSVNEGKRWPTTVLTFPRDKSRLHPTQKPVALCEYLIRTYTTTGQTVLDCCVGSGTVGVAAKQAGREFVGFELDPNYFDLAEKRIADTSLPD